MRGGCVRLCMCMCVCEMEIVCLWYRKTLFDKRIKRMEISATDAMRNTFSQIQISPSHPIYPFSCFFFSFSKHKYFSVVQSNEKKNLRHKQRSSWEIFFICWMLNCHQIELIRSKMCGIASHYSLDRIVVENDNVLACVGLMVDV